MVRGKEEELGYESLIWLSIYEKGQLLKTDRHAGFGVILSGDTEFALKEVYSGLIWKRTKDINQYKRYDFASRNCVPHPDNQLICTHCINIRKQLSRLC